MDHKEIITKEHIIHDLRKATPVRHLIGVSLLIILLGGMVAWLIVQTVSAGIFPYPDLPVHIVYIVYSCIAAAIIVYDIRYMLTQKRSADRCDFHVLTDTLVACESSCDGVTNLDTNFRRYKPTHYMFFSSFGKYRIAETTYYSWSQQYAVGVRGMLTYAVPGDTYYIVTQNDKTILMVYNTKLFDYRG